MNKNFFRRNVAFFITVVTLMIASTTLSNTSTAISMPLIQQSQDVEAPPFYGYYRLGTNSPEKFGRISLLVLWSSNDITPIQLPAGLYVAKSASTDIPDFKKHAYYKYLSKIITPEKFSFTTATVNGISYKFTGRFVRKGVLGDGGLLQDGVEGQLTMIKKGRKVAEGKVQFQFGGPV